VIASRERVLTLLAWKPVDWLNPCPFKTGFAHHFQVKCAAENMSGASPLAADTGGPF